MQSGFLEPTGHLLGKPGRPQSILSVAEPLGFKEENWPEVYLELQLVPRSKHTSSRK